RHPPSHEHPERPALEAGQAVPAWSFGGWTVPGRLGADGKGRALQREDSTQDTRMYSPASLSKGYLATMGITPPLGRFADFPPELLGYAMQAFYGARSECRIRHTVVPIVYTDVLSMYPTVNCLLGTWRLITAESIAVEDCSEDVQATLEVITL